MKRRDIYTFLIAILSFFAGIAIARFHTQSTLGEVLISGTDFRCRVTQQRSLANLLGMGHSRIHSDVIDQNHVTVISDEIPLQPPGAAVWNHQESLPPFQIGQSKKIAIDLTFGGKSRLTQEMTIGILAPPLTDH